MKNIKVTILKDGVWAINPPHPGELAVKQGQKLEVPVALYERMLNASDGPAAKGNKL